MQFSLSLKNVIYLIEHTLASSIHIANNKYYNDDISLSLKCNMKLAFQKDCFMETFHRN